VTARQIDEAATRIHELGVESAQCLSVAVVAAGLSLAATQTRPVLAMPLLFGAVAVGFLGVRALVRRSFLVEDLAADSDADAIPAVRRYIERVATHEDRDDGPTLRAPRIPRLP
jgi:hypothetical protein